MSSTDLAMALECASMRAWPAVEQVRVNGWTLRFSEGYTRRANSATACTSSLVSLDEQISRCEALYRQHSLPAIFRLPAPWMPEPLDAFLASRGYLLADRTNVMAVDLVTLALPEARWPVWRSGDAEEWLSIYETVSGAAEADRPAHLRVLQAGVGETLFVWTEHESQFTGCALGIADGDYLGLYDIAVRPDMRNQGIGTALVASLLQMGSALGARWGYLQVTETNARARQLYERLGFCKVYEYWYRQPATGLAS
jgi:N-acetylglutamate synthase